MTSRILLSHASGIDAQLLATDGIFNACSNARSDGSSGKRGKHWKLDRRVKFMSEEFDRHLAGCSILSSGYGFGCG